MFVFWHGLLHLKPELNYVMSWNWPSPYLWPQMNRLFVGWIASKSRSTCRRISLHCIVFLVFGFGVLSNIHLVTEMQRVSFAIKVKKVQATMCSRSRFMDGK